MSATETIRMPALGQQGDACRACRASLAPDQRYCLNCGERRADTRIDYLAYLAPSGNGVAAQPQPVAAGGPEPPARPARDYAPLTAAGGVVILGLMLLVGVLIGRGNDASPTAAAPPQVVTVGAAATGADADATASKGGSADQAQATGAKDSAGSASKGGSGKGKGGDLSSGGAAGTTEAPVQASTEDLQALEAQSGDNYAQQSAELPDTIATPGEPPPVDNEDPGGGSSATTIK